MAARAARLRAPPRKARKLSGRGALPKQENLVRKTPEDLVRTLRRFGIEPDVEGIRNRVAPSAFARVHEAWRQGVEPDAATLSDVEAAIDRRTTEALRQMTKAAIRNYRDARAAEESRYATWLTVGDTNVCPSCEPRHGQTNTWKAWDRLGRPGSAALVCSRECRCELVPGEDAPPQRR